MEIDDCLHDEQLNIYLDGELTHAEQVSVEAHIEVCGRCKARCEELRRVGEALRGMTTRALDEADFSQVWKRVKADVFPTEPQEEPRHSWFDGVINNFRAAFSPAFAVTAALIVAATVYFSGWFQPHPHSAPPKPVQEATANNETQLLSLETDSPTVMVLQSAESGATIIIISDNDNEMETNEEPTI